MEALESAVVEQMTAVFADTALVGEALTLSRAEEAGGSEENVRRLASIGHELAGARRALDRYFGAFEEGRLSAADCQERIERLRGRIEALEAEERALAQRGSEGLPVKELRVMSRQDILPTYKIPALVRAPEGQVVLTGFEPESPP